ncbi:uncharacterized protein [Littorina saxatilis]|uniref:Uncharacterized protein n=1 Tax=Littorina saxatilis TaxID=31220 RepID=A0AAN9BJG5_9CAEN
MRLCAAIFMYITALPVATQGADVNETCEPFVENSDSLCTCAINTQAVDIDGGNCPSTVGYVRLVFVGVNGIEEDFCTFSDYKLGLIQSTIDDPRFVSCGKVNDGNPDVVTLELWLRSCEPAFIGLEFICKPNCGGGSLTSSISGTHIAYSPDCRPGITGEKCNETCPSDCVGGVCGRELGNCTRIPPPQEKKDNTLAIALGVGVPGLAALLSWLCWCCSNTSTALSILEVVGCGSAERRSDKSSDSDDNDPDMTSPRKDRASVKDVSVAIEDNPQKTKYDPNESEDSSSQSIT